jgi:hypothetical protein
MVLDEVGETVNCSVSSRIMADVIHKEFLSIPADCCLSLSHLHIRRESLGPISATFVLLVFVIFSRVPLQ